MERLKHMKETLMSCVQGQLGDLSSVDAKELGEVIDMIKDLSEAIYYCTITKSMEDSEKEGKQEARYYPVSMYNYRDIDRDMGRMYYDVSEHGNNARGGGTRGYMEYNYAQGQGGGSSRNYPIELRDYREGQSPLTRKTYMERKMHGGDKTAQMQELEKYMQELSHDLIEMVEGSSPEEKQMLQKKLNTLATKIV